MRPVLISMALAMLCAAAIGPHQAPAQGDDSVACGRYGNGTVFGMFL